DGCHGCGRAARNELLGKRTVSTSDVEPFKVLRNVEPVQEWFGGQTAPAAHQSLVSFSVGEGLVSLAHWSPALPSNRDGEAAVLPRSGLLASLPNTPNPGIKTAPRTRRVHAVHRHSTTTRKPPDTWSGGDVLRL